MNINFFKLVLMIFLLNTTIPAIAGKSNDGANSCCHYCRISKNRLRKKPVAYIPCSLCDKHVYCMVCINKKLALKKDEINKIKKARSIVCQPCQKECCCSFKECKKDHEHCFTAKRTAKRHQGHELKWVKCKPADRRAAGGDNEAKPQAKRERPKKREIKEESIDEESDTVEYLLPDLDSSSEEESPPRPKKKNAGKRKKAKAPAVPDRVLDESDNEDLQEPSNKRAVIKLRRRQKALVSPDSITPAFDSDANVPTPMPVQKANLMIVAPRQKNEVGPADFRPDEIVIATVFDPNMVIASPVTPEIVTPEFETWEPRVEPSFSVTYPAWIPAAPQNDAYWY